MFAPYADFFIYSIDIDEKSKKMNARIAFESSHAFDQEDPQYLLAKEYLNSDLNIYNTWDLTRFIPFVCMCLCAWKWALQSKSVDTFECVYKRTLFVF